MIAQSFDMIIQRCLRPQTHNNKKPVMVVCVGDKFAKSTTMFNRALEWRPELFWPYSDDPNIEAHRARDRGAYFRFVE